jgi:hypothetical protein
MFILRKHFCGGKVVNFVENLLHIFMNLNTMKIPGNFICGKKKMPEMITLLPTLKELYLFTQ